MAWAATETTGIPAPDAASSAAPTTVLIAVISASKNFKRRSMLRRWATLDGVSDDAVTTEFVLGDSTYGSSGADRELDSNVSAEAQTHGDIVIVHGREALPHVGKATEKSAAWWLSAPLRSNASFFCKTDDDSVSARYSDYHGANLRKHLQPLLLSRCRSFTNATCARR